MSATFHSFGLLKANEILAKFVSYVFEARSTHTQHTYTHTHTVRQVDKHKYDIRSWEECHHTYYSHAINATKHTHAHHTRTFAHAYSHILARHTPTRSQTQTEPTKYANSMLNFRFVLTAYLSPSQTMPRPLPQRIHCAHTLRYTCRIDNVHFVSI